MNNQLIINNLTQREKEVFETLPETLKPYVAARVGNLPVKMTNDHILKTECVKIITIGYSELSQMGITSDMIQFQGKALFDEIRSNKTFNDMTLPEVQSAFKIGIRGETGPFFGLCTKTYYQFLKYYCTKKERGEAMVKYLEEINKPVITKKPLSDIFKQTAESTLNAFNEYKKDKTLPVVSFAFYDFLWKDLKLINWNKQEKEEIQKSGQELYKKELAEKVISRQLKKSQYESIISNINNASCINKIKKIGLKRYFDKCINEGFDLESELKKHIL